MELLTNYILVASFGYGVTSYESQLKYGSTQYFQIKWNPKYPVMSTSHKTNTQGSDSSLPEHSWRCKLLDSIWLSPFYWWKKTGTVASKIATSMVMTINQTLDLTCGDRSGESFSTRQPSNPGNDRHTKVRAKPEKRPTKATDLATCIFFAS